MTNAEAKQTTVYTLDQYGVPQETTVYNVVMGSVPTTTTRFGVRDKKEIREIKDQFQVGEWIGNGAKWIERETFDIEEEAGDYLFEWVYETDFQDRGEMYYSSEDEALKAIQID